MILILSFWKEVSDMYKIYIKQSKTSRTIFEPYYVIVDDKKIEYETDDLAELADKYKELLAKYTTDQLRAVQDLTTEIEVTIFDN